MHLLIACLNQFSLFKKDSWISQGYFTPTLHLEERVDAKEVSLHSVGLQKLIRANKFRGGHVLSAYEYHLALFGQGYEILTLHITGILHFKYNNNKFLILPFALNG